MLESTKKIKVMFRKHMPDSDFLFDEEVIVKNHISKCYEEDS